MTRANPDVTSSCSLAVPVTSAFSCNMLRVARDPIRWSLSVRSFSSQASDYLQSTIIPTYHFQKSLLRLPIPKLEDTIERYLNAVEPIVAAEEFQETKKVAQEFSKPDGVGQHLHQQLVARDNANKHTSYINEWWYDMYVLERQPVAINVNPQILIRDDPTPAKNTQLQRATSLISSSVRFFRTLRDEQLKPDIYHTKPDKTENTKWFENMCSYLPESIAFYGAAAFGAYPLDMSQYANLFHSTRIPEVGKDRLQVYPDSRHIIIQRGADFYKLNVLDEDGSAVSDQVLHAGIDGILRRPLNTQDTGVGVLTTLNRDEWAQARQVLINTAPCNKTSLDDIDSALFAVCLEHESPENGVETSRCFLAGNGSNHWFDKSFQLIVAANGKASVNFEHAWGDGVAVLRYLQETCKDSHGRTSTVQDSDATDTSELLQWEYTPQTQQTLEEAAATYKKWTDRLLIESVEADVSRDVSKRYKIGIDGLLQMTIQLAHYRLHGNFVSTYESASTSAFKHGRTETVRSCTNAGVTFCKAMCDPAASSQDKEKCLREAAKVHNALTKNGVMGKGCDRHLFGLKKMAELSGEAVPELFTLPSAEKMNKIIISTSTLSSPYLRGGSFGPVNEECYGIGYGMEEATVFQLSAYRPDLPQLKELLITSLHDIVNVLEDGYEG